MVGLERMYAQLEMAYENLSNRYSELAREKREVEQRLMEQEAVNIELRAWNDKLFEEVIKMPVRPMTLEERFAEWEIEHGPIDGSAIEKDPFSAETAVTAIPISKVDTAVLPFITNNKPSATRIIKGFINENGITKDITLEFPVDEGKEL